MRAQPFRGPRAWLLGRSATCGSKARLQLRCWSPTVRPRASPSSPLAWRPQIRNEFALASVLGRAAVVPGIWVGLDSWWGVHSGIIPGSSHTDLPFLAPVDHVLDIKWQACRLPPASCSAPPAGTSATGRACCLPAAPQREALNGGCRTGRVTKLPTAAAGWTRKERRSRSWRSLVPASTGVRAAS